MKYLIALVFLGAAGYLVQGNPVATWDRKPVNELNQRIVGGVDAPKDHVRHMVALVFGILYRSMMCGATIISYSHVLTAAHCIEPLVEWNGQLTSSLRGVIGTTEWKNEQITVSFTHHINHEDWDSWNIKNDAGVLFVKGKIPLGDKIAVIPLESRFIVEEESFVAGWGWNKSGMVPDTMQILNVTAISPEECVDRIRHLPNILPYDPKVEICSFHSKDHGNCYGDSGSALVTRRTHRQIGIVSWGVPCAQGFPDFYTRISAIMNFLQRVMES